MVQHGPWSSVTELDAWEEHGVEVDVVLAHELIKTYVLLVEPPFLPVRCQVCGYTRISNGGIKLKKKSREY